MVLTHKDIEYGCVLTDVDQTLCKCCGRMMGFVVEEVNFSWTSKLLHYGCIGDPIHNPCSYDTTEQCKDNHNCPIVDEDVEALALYYLQFFMDLLEKHRWKNVTFLISNDPLLMRIVSKIIEKDIPAYFVSKESDFTISIAHKNTQKIRKKKIKCIDCVVLTRSKSEIPLNAKSVKNLLLEIRK